MRFNKSQLFVNNKFELIANINDQEKIILYEVQIYILVFDFLDSKLEIKGI